MPSSPLLDYLVAHEPLFRASRIPSLYSDLSVQKSSNPEGYAANVTAWTAALNRAALSGHLPPAQQSTLVLHTGEELLDALVSARYGRPSGLGCVLDECVRTGKFIDEKDFLAAEKSIYSRSWIPSPWAVLRWSLRQAGLDWSGSYEIRGGRLKKGDLVLVPALEEAWRRLQPLILERGAQGLTDRVVGREVFAKEVGEVLAAEEGGMKTKNGSPILSEQDLQVLLRYLSRDKQILSYDDTTIKYKPASAPTPEPITQEDHSIASLQSLIQTLERQTSSLSIRISTFQTQAAVAVKSGNKPSALSALRSKKLADHALQSRLATLTQLEEVFSKIEAAVSQVDVLSAMESSATTLKFLNRKIGGVDRVEDVLESLREQVSKVDEVSGVLSEVGGVDQKALLDEGEVDDELEQMEREEREKMKVVEEGKTREKLQESDALEQIRRETERERENERKQVEKEKLPQRGEEPYHPSTETATEKNKEDAELEELLSTSTEKLRRLDIDERAALDPESKQAQPQRSTEPVAERTS